MPTYTPFRAFGKQRVNIKLEAVAGTLEPVINQRLTDLSVIPSDSTEMDMFMAAGSAVPTASTAIDIFSAIAVSGRFNFDSVIYLLASLLGMPTTTHPGTLAYLHDWAWDGLAQKNPASYSVAYGDVQGAVEVAGVVFNSLGFTLTRDAVPEISSSGFGKALQTGKVLYPREASYLLTITATGGTYDLVWAGQTAAGIAFGATGAQILTALIALSNVAPGDLTVTPSTSPGPFTIAGTNTGAFAGLDVIATIVTTSLTGGSATLVKSQAGGPAVAIAPHTVSPTAINVYLNSSWATLGSTQLLDVVEAEPSVGDRHVRVKTLTSTGVGDGVAESDSQTHTLRLKFIYDATAETQIANMKAGTFVFVRYEAVSPTNSIESGHSYYFKMDQALLIESVGQPESFGGGVMAIDVTGRWANDPVSSNCVTAQVKNSLVTIV